jgi:membrane protein DedA with SNARE-associated domain
LSWIIIYGPMTILAVLFLGALGAPAPGTFLVLATGAFVRQGVLDLEWVLPSALLGVCLGDMASFGIGRFARSFIPDRLAGSSMWQKAEAELAQRGGGAIYLTRWLLTPIAVPVNLVAGSTGYPFRRFLAFDVAGEVTWLLLYGTLGYLFSSQWEAISELISNFSGVLVGVAALGVGVYVLLRIRQGSAR